MDKQKHGAEPPIDLESSSQIELDRTFGCNSDSVEIVLEPGTPIREPQRQYSQTTQRELLKNNFPTDP